MAVLCPACKTENRDAAKFCHGCAGKLPAFAATGPSALDAMKGWRSPSSPDLPASSAARLARQVPLPGETAGFWIRVGLLVLGAAIALVGWYAYVTRKSTPPAAVASAIAATVRVGPQSMPVPPVSLVSSLSTGEGVVTADPEPKPAPTLVEPMPAPQSMRLQAPRPLPSRIVALDPRQGCDNLNFFAAARCEAANCDKPQYTRHPRCDAVREDRRRDYARRNPTMGF